MYSFPSVLCFSAPGSRYSGSGGLLSVGYHGFSWSSATNDIYGLDLNFYVTGLNTGYPDYRAYGFQLRCLSE
ncbi:hypothetical protein [uncultured Rikenella sp.]|uniref:hypothetical protein n=1 Tax=uncultured Rikenella sp. TaxID=368003 RepID=UPI002603AE9A|nr:hypothetical protein [uncultured Rikenella sp.]